MVSSDDSKTEAQSKNAVEISILCGQQRLSILRWGHGPRHVVLLHGFPDNAFSMHGLASRFAEQGCTIWAPFLRGYAPSDFAWDGRYDLHALTDDVVNLLNVIEAKDCILIGHDWGAVIAYAVSARGCARLSRVVALSVPPVPVFLRSTFPLSKQLFRSRYMFFFQARGWSDWLIRKTEFRLIGQLWRRWSPTWSPPKGRIDQVITALQEQGRLEAALDYYRHNLPSLTLRGRATWTLMNKAPRHPVSCLVGMDDNCIHPSLFDSVGYPVIRLRSSGHFLPLEAPDAVVEHVLKT